MKKFKELLIELRAYSDVIEWVEDKTIEEVVDHAIEVMAAVVSKRVDIGLHPYTCQSTLCYTVRHL